MDFLFQFLIDFSLTFLPAAFLYSKNKNPLKELGLVFSGLKKDIPNAFKLLAVLFAVSFILSATAVILGIDDTQVVYERINEVKSTAPLLLAYLLVARVVSEEIFFRGFLAKQLGAEISSVAFGLAHVFYGSAVEVAGAIALGYVLAKAYEANKSIIPNIAAHFLYNLAIVLIV